MLATDADASGADLPGVAHGGVGQRVVASPAWRLSGDSDELFSLHRQQRQRHRFGTVDRQAGGAGPAPSR